MILGRYFFIGVCLSVSGMVFAIVSYSIAHLIPFAGLGIAVAIVGLTSISLPPQVTGSDAMKYLIRGAALGIEPLLNEICSAFNTGFNLPKSIYLPPDGQAVAVYIPLNNEIPSTVEDMRLASKRLMQPIEDQKGVLVFTPASALNFIPEIRNKVATVEEGLEFVLIESAELCSSVRATEIENMILVEINNVKIESESNSYRKLLGSLPSSIAASIIAIAKASPVIIQDEEVMPSRTIARFLVLDLNKGQRKISELVDKE